MNKNLIMIFFFCLDLKGKKKVHRMKVCREERFLKNKKYENLMIFFFFILDNGVDLF